MSGRCLVGVLPTFCDLRIEYYLYFMNKGRRHELKMLKYKKRLNLYGLKEEPDSNLYAFRSHSVPCSCGMCKSQKYNRSEQKQNVIREVIGELEYTEDNAWEIYCETQYEIPENIWID